DADGPRLLAGRAVLHRSGGAGRPARPSVRNPGRRARRAARRMLRVRTGRNDSGGRIGPGTGRARALADVAPTRLVSLPIIGWHEPGDPRRGPRQADAIGVAESPAPAGRTTAAGARARYGAGRCSAP